jgi:DNA topoisomerase-3
MAPIRALNVAEKPSVARGISGILSRDSMSTRRGTSKYNPIHSFNLNINGTYYDMTVTSVTGHLMSMDFDAAFSNWERVDPLTLFTAPIHSSIPREYNDIANQLSNLSRQADLIILWLDCDREGEAIGFEVLSVCQKANPRIQVSRARFSALIPRYV